MSTVYDKKGVSSPAFATCTILHYLSCPLPDLQVFCRGARAACAKYRRARDYHRLYATRGRRGKAVRVPGSVVQRPLWCGCNQRAHRFLSSSRMRACGVRCIRLSMRWSTRVREPVAPQMAEVGLALMRVVHRTWAGPSCCQTHAAHLEYSYGYSSCEEVDLRTVARALLPQYSSLRSLRVSVCSSAPAGQPAFCPTRLWPALVEQHR
jgi:hypothetical protein